MFVAGVLLFSLVLLRIPNMLGEDVPPLLALLTLLPFVAAIASLLAWKGRWRAAPPVLLAAFYIMLVLVAVLRSTYVGTIQSNVAIFEATQIILVAALGCLAFLREAASEQRRRYLSAVCWAPVVFVSVNVALHLVGFVAPGQEATTGLEATTLGLFGIGAERVQFAAAGGINGIGPTAAAAFAICCVIFRDRHWLSTIGGAVCLYAILLTDSRASLVFAFLAAALVLFTPRHRRRLGWLAYALPALPVLVVVVLGGLEDSQVAAKLNRSGAQSVSEGTGRSTVWAATWQELSTPKADHLFGYGQNGQVVSRVSVDYAPLFDDDADPLTHSTHSLILQTALDLGWIGLACLIALAAAVLGRLNWWARRERAYAPLLAGAFAVLFVGILEAAPTPGHLDSFAWWLLVIFAGLRARPLAPPAVKWMSERLAAAPAPA